MSICWMGNIERGATWTVSIDVLVFSGMVGSQKFLRRAAEYEPANTTFTLDRKSGRAERASKSCQSSVSLSRKGLCIKYISRRLSDRDSPSMSSIDRFRILLIQRLSDDILPILGTSKAVKIASAEMLSRCSKLRCSPLSKANRRSSPAERVFPSRAEYCRKLSCSISLKLGTSRTSSKMEMSKLSTSIVLC